MDPERERLKAILVDTVTLLCKNGLSFVHDLKVQGLLAVTADNDSVFVVHINETFDLEVKKSVPSTKASTFSEPLLGSERAQSVFSHSNSSSGKRKRVRLSLESHSVSSAGNAVAREASLISSANTKSAQNVQPKTGLVTYLPVKLEGNLDSDANETSSVMLIDSDDQLDDKEELKDVGKELIVDSFTPNNRSVKRIQNKVARSRFRNNTFQRTDHNQSQSHEFDETRTVKDEPAYSVDGSLIRSFSGKTDVGMADDLLVIQDEGDQSNNSAEHLKWDESGLDENEADEYYNDSSMDPASWDLDAKGGVVCQYERCGKWFNYQRNLDRHQRRAHGAKYGMTGQMCYFCTIPDCMRTFYKECNLLKHQQDTHGLAVLI